ncbi:MAG: DUF5011 domain-containing protein [Cenarchaeum sp. SB0677_bin_16]|nr:DUF5011 domain-containing protein [Cenarchaeum sp. SB0677_bin_16]
MNYIPLLLLPLLVLVTLGVSLTVATTEPDDAPDVDNSTASLTITTHNPRCTAVNLDYLEITRLTDIQPGYPPANFTSGINITAIIWTHDANVTIPAILRPEVSSVAMYSHTTSNATANATSPGQPELLRLDTNPDVVIPVFGQSPCDSGAWFLMNLVDMEGAKPGTGPMGIPPSNRTEPEPAGAVGASDDEPAPLILVPRPSVTHYDESGTLYSGDLMGVSIRSHAGTANDIWRYLQDNGALVFDVIRGERVDIVGAYIPHSIIWPLSTLDGVKRVLPVQLPPHEHYGSINTEGLLPNVHPNVEQWHVLGYNGTGVRVGIIDGSFNLQTTTGNDLPPLADITCRGGCGSGINSAGVHGMAVTEIVMDMAPGAQLFLSDTTSRLVDLHTAVDWLIGQNVSIISMSMRFPFEGPGDGTSPVMSSAISAVDNAVDNNILWVNSAGNYGESSWLASGTDVQTVRVEIRADRNNPARHITYIDFDTGPGNATTNHVQSSSGPNDSFGTTLDLRWHGGGELHLALFDANGNMLENEAQRTYDEGEPAKSLDITRAGRTDFRIWVEGSTVPDWIQLVSYTFNTRLGWNSTDGDGGGVNTPSDSHDDGMLAVGAAPANITATDFARGFSFLDEPDYSSRGDHPGPQGTRDKPDIYGASHVTTDAYWNWLPNNIRVNSQVFPGTSAAAPHIAGLAALVMDYHNHTLTHTQTADYLKDNMNTLDIAGLPSLGPPPPPTTLHSNPFQQTIIDTVHPTVHLGRADSVYTLAIRWNVDSVYWRAISSNTTVASVVDPNLLSEMRSVFSGTAWFDDVIIHPHNPGTTTITVNVTDNRAHWTKSFDVTVTDNTQPRISTIGPQHIDIDKGAHIIEFTANDVDGDALSWRYVFQDHTYFTISAPGDCEDKQPFQECALPGNTLSVVPVIEGENSLLYGVYDGRGGNDIDAVEANIGPNTDTVHGNTTDVTMTSGESVTVRLQATDADGDVIIHLTPRLNDISIAEAGIPFHLSNQEVLDVRSVSPTPGYAAESVTYENNNITSMTVLKEAPSGNKLRYVVNGTGGLSALPESVIITNPYERSSGPTTANLTITITGLSPGNTTVYSTVRDVWGGSDTKNFTVTVLPAAPVITLLGQTNMTIPFNTTYVEPGYTATDREDGNLTGNVTVTGTVNTNTIGTYTIHYDVTDSAGNNATQQNRTVNVVDETPPSITLMGPANMTVLVNSTYIEPGYTATDNVDGDITSRVVVTGMVNVTKAGTYRIHYDVTDDAGNQAIRQNRTVTVAPNMHPLADAGVDQTIQIGGMVTLDASASKDIDGDTLSYAWRQTSGLTVILSNDTAPYATFTAPGIAGTLKFEVTVSDGFDTDADTVTIIIVNRAPTAKAGIDQTVHRLQTVSLDGSASYDPDRYAISHVWEQTGGPAVALSNSTAPAPSFTAPNGTATITFELTVSDGTYSDTDTVTIHVVNRPPVANAGPDRTVQSGENMTLNGTASTDADGDILSYSWSVVTGPRISLTNPDNAQVSFVAPTGPVLLGILLTVHDGWDSSQDLVVIDVLRPPNRPPISDAGIDQTAGYGKTIQLDGSASHDPDSDTISYVWNQTAGIAVSLSDHMILHPAFTTPNATTSITFELTVSDGHLAHTDAVTVTVANHPPVVDAGTDRAAGFGHIITLDGSASDPDGDAISYVWNQTSGPAVILSDNAALSPSFAAPASMATMTFEITASDGWLSHTDAVAITVVNHPPTSDAGADQTVRLGDTVTLDGSASTDPDGDAISYMWNQTEGPAVALSDDAASSPTFTAPSSAGILTFELTASDGYDTDTDTVTITVVNRPPVASAGADQTVRFGDTVTLDGSASYDPDNDDVTYLWKETSGTGTKLSDIAVQSPTFTAPGSAATITFELTVSDGEFGSTDTVTITVKHPNRAPTANAGPDHTAGVGDTITLSAAASTDPDNDTLTYTWEVLIGPSQVLSGTTGPSVTVTVPSGVGLLGIYLTVSDGQYASQDLVVITVE